MYKNILLAYLLAFCKNSWFWLGIWVFYYLRFTNYAGIGIIEMSLITSMTLTEVPTGAIADLLGKRKILFLSFLLQGLGAMWMAVTGNLWGLVGSVFVSGIGGSFYSGTLEALVYDSLKQEKIEAKYDQVISNINSVQLVAPAICGLVGGFMYTISPSLPFIANSLFYFAGMLAAVFLVEPHIDSVKFSFNNYVSQTKQGLRELFKTETVKRQSLLLLSVGVIVVIMDEMLNSFLGVEFGFSAEMLGVMWAAIYVIAALVSQFTLQVKKLFGEHGGLILVGLLIAATLLISPVLGLITGGISLLFRSSLQPIYGNLTSIAINNSTESRFRATTLSTFNMLKNIPYVLTAYLFGSFADIFTAKTSAFVLGLILATLLATQVIRKAPVVKPAIR